jgi:hypothetical protein
MASHPQHNPGLIDQPTPDAESQVGAVGGFHMPTTPDANSNSLPDWSVGHKYGDGPDLDHNGVPDDVGINPDSLHLGQTPVAQTPSSEPPLLPSPHSTEVPPVEGQPDSVGPTPHPTQSNLLDPTSQGHTLHPDLLDPTAPGPTLDHGLVDQIHQDPHLVNAVNQNPDLAHALERDPSSLEQVTHDMGLTTHQQSHVEPSGVTNPSTSGHDFHDPSLTDHPGHTDLGAPDHGVDDHHLHA